MKKKKEIDCLFDDEFVDTVKYMLYHTNAGGQAANPPHPSWYTAANYPENAPERYEERARERDASAAPQDERNANQ